MKKRLCFILAAAMVVGMAQTSFVYADDKSDDKEFAGTTLRFLDVSPSEARQSYYEGAFSKFEDETGITVTYEKFHGMMQQIRLQFWELLDSCRMF